jgi:predicted dehydrogenase
MNALRVAVVGVGHLGQHHARLLSRIEGVDLVGAVDTRPTRAAAVAAEHGTKPYTDAAEVLGNVDAVSIAVPTEVHEAVAAPFLERGCAVLVEKPIAASLEEADRMIATAERHGALLAVGHTERFNPAVVAARPYLAEPGFVEVHRLGVFPDRSLDIDVVFDLMIHDLDLLLALVGSDITDIEAVGVNVLTPRVDIANARIRFASGCIANLTASRISKERIRKARFFARNTYVSIDFAAREVEVYGLVREGGAPRVDGGKIDVPPAEPLGRELEDFVAAVRGGRPSMVTGRDGRAALALATEIADQIARADRRG